MAFARLRTFGGFARRILNGESTELEPVVVNFTELPDGVVGQQTEYVLDISGTPPFYVGITTAPELVGRVTVNDIPGGSKRFVGVPPNEGNTAVVQKTVTFDIWNAHPDTDLDAPITTSCTWDINPAAVDADWGTPGALTDAEVGVPYAFYATTLTGTGPFVFARTAGLTVAQLNAAGLSLRTGSTSSPELNAMIFGTPLPGSENTLGSSITIGVSGYTTVQDTNAFTAGIVIRRKPTLELTTLQTITTGAGSFDFTPFLRGYPAAHIAVASGSALPSGFSLGSDILTWTGLTDSNNGTSADIVFDITNGYHTASTATLVIQVSIPATNTISFDVQTRKARTNTADPDTSSHVAAASGIGGVLMFALSTGSDPHVTGMTYGGATVPELTLRDGSIRTLETGFLGTSVLQGTQTASWDFDSATTDDIELIVLTINGTGNLEVQDEDGAAATAANASVTLTTGGALCQAYAMIGVAVADVASLTNGAGLTTIQEVDQGTSIWRLVRQTTPSTSDFTVGFTHASAAHVLQAVTVKLVQVAGCPGSTASWSKAGKANGVAVSTLVDDVEVTTLQDNASALTIWTEEAGTSSAHTGPLFETTGTYLKFRDANADTLTSLGYEVNLGNPPYWLAFTMQVPDTQVAGERCFLTTGGTRLYLERTGATSIVFRIGNGASRVSATAVDAVTSAVRILFYVVDANTCGIAYSLTGTISYDSGNSTMAAIGQQFLRTMFNAGGLGPADYNLQAVAFGAGTPNKAAIVSWLDAAGTLITPPPPPVNLILRENCERCWDPRLTMPQHAVSVPLRTGFNPPHGTTTNSTPASMGTPATQVIMDVIHTDSIIIDTQGNHILKRQQEGSVWTWYHEIRKAWPTWYTGNTTSRSRVNSMERGPGTMGALLRMTQTYWLGYSCKFISGGAVPWPSINQIVVDWKQPTGIGQQSLHNSQPRLELTPGGVIRLQRLKLNAGAANAGNIGQNATPFQMWSKQLVLDRWYHWVFKYRLAGKAGDGPLMQGWLAEADGPLVQIVNDSEPNSYEYTGTDAYFFHQIGIYNWDVNRGGAWDFQKMRSGLVFIVKDGFGTPAPTAANMHATLMDLF